LLHRGAQIALISGAGMLALDADDVEDLEEAPDDEVEAAEAEILDQATAARTIVELKAEIETLKELCERYEKSGGNRCFENPDDKGLDEDATRSACPSVVTPSQASVTPRVFPSSDNSCLQ
jgi:hypothetical protein